MRTTCTSGRIFEALIQNEAWIPADAHSVKLDTYLQRVKLGDARPAPGSRQIARLYTRHESSAAYLLSRDGAERYLELTANSVSPADYSLFPKYPHRLGLRVYQLNPAVAIQDHLLPAAEGGHTFPTAMASSDASRPRTAKRVGRETKRLVSQVADWRQAIYVATVLKPVTTTVAFR